LRRFVSREGGSLFIEALIVIPFVTVFAVGVLEFGNIFWQRHQMQVGVRDAARYWARCRDSIGGVDAGCSETVARNIAFYGTPNVSASVRVPGWTNAADLVLTPATAAGLVLNPDSDDLVVATGTHDYQASPLFGLLNLDTIAITVRHEERYFGW
jgi:Flp pilus assembly protein TadG